MWYSTSVSDLIYLHVVATLFKTSPLWSSKFYIFCDKNIQMNGNSSNMKLFLILFGQSIITSILPKKATNIATFKSMPFNIKEDLIYLLGFNTIKI